MNRFVTLGKSSNHHIRLVQLQFENDGYAQLRSIEKPGHENRPDTEVQHEESEGDEREIYRGKLLNKLASLRKYPERKLMLKIKLEVPEKADQQRRER